MPSEAAARADFSGIRYGQVWEDADVLLEALAVNPGDVCLSIASAGDNTLALLARGPRQVIALDLSPAQLACLALRVAAFRTLDHPGVLELVGSLPSDRRPALYRRVRSALEMSARTFWDARPEAIARGVGWAGKFENYFRLFRKRLLPLAHGRKTVEALLEPRSAAERERFYDQTWNTWRWRRLFGFFFSRPVMGALGRDPSFFRYVEGSVAARILTRTRHALTVLEPDRNPYLQGILTGTHRSALPFYLREENFDPIRAHLDRLTWRLQPLEDFLETTPDGFLGKCNLSDIFEYVSPERSAILLRRLSRALRPGGRVAYWNMLAPRAAPPGCGLESRPELAARLHLQDKAFFYSAFVVEERE